MRTCWFGLLAVLVSWSVSGNAWSADAGQPKLLHRYDFENATAEDSVTPGGMDGTFVGDLPEFVSDARSGRRALKLNGAGQYIKFEPMDFGDRLSIAAWVKLEDNPVVDGPLKGRQALAVVLTNCPAGGLVPGFGVNINNQWGVGFDSVLQAGTGDGNKSSCQFTYGIDHSKWHHLAVTIDFVAQETKLYVDGKPAQLFSNVSPVPLSTTPRTGPWTIGGFRDGHCSLKGLIDDVRIYSGLLSDVQVAELLK